MFGAGVVTFGLLYCVQPLMPLFSRLYGVSAAGSALSLSLPSGVLAVAVLFAGAVSDAWGRPGPAQAALGHVRHHAGWAAARGAPRHRRPR
jgi:YNFM family putative membrane transporter